MASLYDISANTSFLHCKLFENIRIFKYFALFKFYLNIFHRTNNIRYSILTLNGLCVVCQRHFQSEYIFTNELFMHMFFMCLESILTWENLQTQITNPIISSSSLITMFSLISILYKVGRKLSSCALIESVAKKLRTRR